MAIKTQTQIKTEILNFIRNSDVFSIATRGVTTTTETFSGTGAQVAFSLTNTTMKNVRAVSISSVAQEYGTDYTISFTPGVVTFVTAPASGTNNISITYDYGTNDKIFPDFPQPYLKLSDFPRIGMDIISHAVKELGLGGGSNYSNIIFSISVYDEKTKNVEGYIDTLRSLFMANKKSFYTFRFITPTAVGPMIASPFGEQKIFQRNLDLSIDLIYEN